MMRSLRIKTTAMTMVAFLLGLLAISSLSAIWNQHRMISATHRITHNSLPVIYGVGSALSTVKDLRGKMRAHIVSETAAEKDKGELEIGVLSRQLDQEIESMGKFLPTRRRSRCGPWRVPKLKGSWTSGRVKSSR